MYHSTLGLRVIQKDKEEQEKETLKARLFEDVLQETKTHGKISVESLFERRTRAPGKKQMQA